jgi:lipopolysaccharide export system permease protein
MFGTLSRYVAARVLLMIGAVFALCLVLIFMIDIVELLRIAGKSGKIPFASVLGIVLMRLPSFGELTMPFATLAGTIGAFLMLNRSAEIIVTRAAGMSVWQFVTPGFMVALGLGVFAVGFYNPFAANARAASERSYAKTFGEQSSLLATGNGGRWLRQDGVDGSSVLNAQAAANQGQSLTGVEVIQYDRAGTFVEHIEAASAELNEGYWELSNAIVTRPRAQPEHYPVYLVSTYLTPTQVQESLGSEFSVSFWQLPGLIDLAEKAGLPASAFRVQYATLLARPLLFAVMVLLAGTVALRTFRFGKIQTMVVVGLVFGFAFFIVTEVVRQMGVAGLCSSMAAGFAPVAVAGLMSATVLLHQEDG